jgi:hypothetical protein
MSARDAFLLAYLDKMPPALWVAWYSAVRDAKSQSALGKILFDPSTNALRNLTTASIRAAVVKCVLKHKPLKMLVSQEADALVAAIQTKFKKG